MSRDKCPKCPNCGKQMVWSVEPISGIGACYCSSCKWISKRK